MDTDRLTVHNESHLNGELVDWLVRLALEPLEINRSRLVVVISDSRHRYVWQTRIYDRRSHEPPAAVRILLPPRTRFVFVVRIGHPSIFPARGLADWREALVAGVAYTARLAQDAYDNHALSRPRCRTWAAWMLSRLRAVEEPWARPLSYAAGDSSRPSLATGVGFLT